MKEKKRTNKWFYSTSGKRFRGLLCMITFAAFVVSAVVTIYAVDRYESMIIFNPEPDFTKHSLYQRELEKEAEQLLYDMDLIYNNHSTYFDLVGVADISGGNSHIYNVDSFYNTAKEIMLSPEAISSLWEYEYGTSTIPYHDLADYNNISRILSGLIEQNEYLYMDTDTFKGLFQKNGLPNTNQRFSWKFSSEAYFIFDLQEAADLNQFLTEEECDKLGFEYTEKKPFYNLTNDVDFTADYAVYDPEQDLFYTPKDEYFGPMECYIYNLDALVQALETADPDTTKYNSIIIPMLNCYNYTINEFVNTACMDYEQKEDAYRRLNTIKDSGIFYYYEKGKEIYSNAGGLSELLDMPNHYKIERSADRRFALLQDAVEKGQIDAEDLWYRYPDGMGELYIGIAGGALGNNIEPIVSYYQEYGYLVKYTWIFAVIAILTGILTLIQAVQLIQTTGKRSQEDKDITRNRFDELPTELWLIIVIGILAACITYGDNLYYFLYVRMGSNVYAVLKWVVRALCIAMPFAFCVMLFSLSLVRRIRTHNLWNRMFSRRIFAKRKVFQNMQGTKKLVALFVLYIVVNFVFTVLLIGLLGLHSFECFMIGGILYLMIQGLALLKIAGIIKDINTLTDGVREIAKGDLEHKIETDKTTGIFQELTDGINHIGDGLKVAVETSLKDERMKTELITNVSHDLKTPLTSIINYIELLKAEKMPTPEAEHYIEVLDRKAQRMKQLAEDLVEAAKATSGNIELEMMPIAFDELMKQAFGEFEDKFAEKELTLVTHYTDEKTVVLADGRRLYRVIENVLQNVYKYALSGTRVYADLNFGEKTVTFMLRNISAAPLNISPEELMERFTRGDSSRTTEGSGLGLSIARDLTNLQGGSFEIQLDGDLFKVIIQFPQYEKEETP